MGDEQAVAATIQIYFDAMYLSDEDKVHQAFHPNAKIIGYMGKNLLEQTVDEFANFVGAQSPSAKAKGEAPLLDILSVDISGNTAVAKVRDGYLGMTFVDTLSILQLDGNWVIYNKLFHVET
jgi:hypothetical protein